MLETGFLLLGLTIIAGFFSLVFFERTKIPNVLLLMFLGVLIGPVLGLVDTGFFTSLAPFVGALALIIILFDGGMKLNLAKVLGELAPATGFTAGVFLLTAALTAAVMHFAFGWSWAWGALLGVVLGGSSGNIVIPLVSRLDASEDTRLLLNLESALTDALCIVGAIAIIGVIKANSLFDSSAVLNSLLGSFAIAAAMGIIAGLLWLRGLKALHGKPFAYMLTLAALFILYAVVEGVKANGAIGVLVFGLIIGNSKTINQALGSSEEHPLDGVLRGFQTEVSFFVTTFFFVYLGLIFDLKAVTASAVIASLAVLVAIIAARFLCTKAFVRLQPRFGKYRLLITTMMPRGLAAAVLAGLPAANGINIPMFAELAFLAIISTNLATTLGAIACASEGKGIDSSGGKNAKAAWGGEGKPRVTKKN